MPKKQWLKIIKYSIPIVICITPVYTTIDFFHKYIRYIRPPTPSYASTPSSAPTPPSASTPSSALTPPSASTLSSPILPPQLELILNYPKDNGGVVLCDYNASVNRSVTGLKYNPSHIAETASALIEGYAQYKDQRVFNMIIDQEKWLEEKGKVLSNGGVVWQYDFPLDSRYKNLKVPWSSAFAQSAYIKYCVTAYQVLKDEKYLNHAHRALLAFEVDIKEDGVCWFGPDGLVFYEEVPSDPPHHIIYGMLTTLTSIWSYYEISHDELAKKIFDQGEQSVELLLPQYDTGFYSRYSLNPDADLNDHFAINSWNYHYLLIMGLCELHQITGKEIFFRYANIFQKYKAGWFDRLIRGASFAFKYFIINKNRLILSILLFMALIIYIFFVFLLPWKTYYYFIITGILIVMPFGGLMFLIYLS